MPFTAFLVVALLLVYAAIANPDSLWIKVLSFLPPLAPVLMPARLALGHAAGWEFALAAGIEPWGSSAPQPSRAGSIRGRWSAEALASRGRMLFALVCQVRPSVVTSRDAFAADSNWVARSGQFPWPFLPHKLFKVVTELTGLEPALGTTWNGKRILFLAA